MPRGDLMYSDQLNHGMRKKYGISPSHNCVWVESNLTDEELEDRWKAAFGKTTNRKELTGECECTCSYREINENGKDYMLKSDCNLHGKGYKKEMKVTRDIPGFSKRQKKRVQQFVQYGKGNIKEIIDRN